jgi:hypothetical protein
MFTPSNMLLKYLNKQPRNTEDVVSALIGYLDTDPNFETDNFDRAVDYVLNHGMTESELFSDFDSSLEFEEDELKWTKDYYSYARIYLKDNFCRKRIEHLKTISHKIHPVDTGNLYPHKNSEGSAPLHHEPEERSTSQSASKSYRYEREQTTTSHATHEEKSSSFTQKELLIGGVLVVVILIGLIASCGKK